MIPKSSKWPVTGKRGWFAWFGTRRGKNFSLGCAITFGIGTCSFNFFRHTFFLDDYRELLQLYNKSMPVRLPKKIHQQFNSVLADLDVPPETRSLIRPFMVAGFDLFYAGSTLVKSGAIVGIPTNFTYESSEDIDKSRFLIQDRKIDWKRPESQDLLGALVLSEQARKFALAQEVLRCQTAEPLLNSSYPIFGIGSAYLLGRTINVASNGFARPFIWRAIVYFLVGLFSYGNWALIKDFTTIHYDSYCLEETSKLGSDYIKGGQEFYAKILQRNKALRSLLGDDGVSLYSATGNENFFIRRKRLAVASRKYFMDKQAESLN